MMRVSTEKLLKLHIGGLSGSSGELLGHAVIADIDPV
jgi:hypothetical protein